MRVFVSTSDKTGLVEFLKPLTELDLQLISTGGTAQYLRDHSFNVIDVSQVTGFPEVLDGRVKTLHPLIHMGLLADRSNAEHMDQLQKHGVKSFDLVIGNLYPFEKVASRVDAALPELIENIDIGGPSFLRAAAKNYRSVAVLSSAEDYSWVQSKILSQGLNDEDRKKLALKVFSLTSYYDALIVERLSQELGADSSYYNRAFRKKMELRYGENSQQSAVWYSDPLESAGLATVQVHQGKELSYNNLLDLDAALGLCRLFSEPACVAVKHNNPCGAAVANEINLAACKAYQADSKSIFGGIVALNRKVDLKTCEIFKDVFLECLLAPGFQPEALEFLARKKNLRVLTADFSKPIRNGQQVKSVSGGLLVQQSDCFLGAEGWNQTANNISASIKEDILFGEKVAAYLKSNAIAIVARGQTLGLGMGQVNRVDAVKQAIERMRENQQQLGFNIEDVVLVSDAFFPFPDSVELIAEAGIKWIAQPGGSVQDAQVIACANQKNIGMVMTNRRHFKH